MKFSKKIISLFLVSLFLTACASAPTQESTGQYIDNSVLTAKVKSKLISDPETSGLAITVNSYKNTVQLSGFVDTQSEAIRATELAKQVPGVRFVKNDLTIK